MPETAMPMVIASQAMRCRLISASCALARAWRTASVMIAATRNSKAGRPYRTAVTSQKLSMLSLIHSGRTQSPKPIPNSGWRPTSAVP